MITPLEIPISDWSSIRRRDLHGFCRSICTSRAISAAACSSSNPESEHVASDSPFGASVLSRLDDTLRDHRDCFVVPRRFDWLGLSREALSDGREWLRFGLLFSPMNASHTSKVAGYGHLFKSTRAHATHHSPFHLRRRCRFAKARRALGRCRRRGLGCSCGVRAPTHPVVFFFVVGCAWFFRVLPSCTPASSMSSVC